MIIRNSFLSFLASASILRLVIAGGNGNDHPVPNEKQLKDEIVRIPVIDLGPWYDSVVNSPIDREVTEPLSPKLSTEQQDIVQRIRLACREVGFFQITGVPDSRNNDGKNNGTGLAKIMEQTWKASRDFFDLPNDEKLEHTTEDNTKYPYGYERSETLVRGKLLDREDGDIGCDGGDDKFCASSEAIADLKETFALGPPDGNGSGMPPRRWINSPNVSPDFRLALEAYYERMEDVALVLLEIFAIALEESADFFRDKMDHHMSALRLVHYYPLGKDPMEIHGETHKASLEDSGPIQRLVRAGAHTDYGALTILAAQDEGLEVLLRDKTRASDGGGGGGDENNDIQGYRQTWYPVPLVPGAFIVNLGDLMQRWTNNEWISTMHRVVMPSTEAQERRYSMAYFVNINGDTPIEPLKCCQGGGSGDFHHNNHVITAGEHLMAKHLASMGITIGNDDKAENISEHCDTMGESYSGLDRCRDQS